LSITLYLATKNPGKIREVNRILAALPGDLKALAPPGGMPDVVEDADTFEGNARIKAIALSCQIDGWALADDSGLVVDALEGAPGVHSARYGEPELPGLDDAGRARLVLERMSGVEPDHRTARFVCVLALARGGTVEATFEGVCEGEIAFEARGQSGFGYDPIFYFPGAGRTFGELPPAEKDRYSHRAQALWRLAEHLTAPGTSNAQNP